MTSELTANGLSLDSLTTITDNLKTRFQDIYGADINVDSNSPDGQIIGIFAQFIADKLDLLRQINNSFNPELCEGIVQDLRFALNNIQRRGATFTQQTVAVTIDRSLTLEGLDADAENPDGTGFTVADDTGNQFILLDTAALTAGTHDLAFRAKDLGSIETTPNTITEIVTVVLGVTAVNNPSSATEIGQDEETDLQFRIRRRKSTALYSQGYLDGIVGKIANLDGVTDVIGFQNDTSSTDSNGLVAKSLYLIVEGGANTDIAEQIYIGKSAGCATNGAVEVDVEESNGNLYPVKFDRPVGIPLYIQFDVKLFKAGAILDEDALKAYIVANKEYEIYETATSDILTEIAKTGLCEIVGDGCGAIINLEISDDDITYDYLIDPTALKNKFTLSAANITINVL